MDEQTDDIYQGTGFSGERMSSSQTAPFAPAPTAAPPAPSPPQPGDWTSATPPSPATSTEQQTGDTMGRIALGLVLGLVFGIFAIAGVALLSAPEKRGDRVTGAVAGWILGIMATIAVVIAAG
jgi:predicted lipid-binding transport protein (Tim44 family)